MSKALLIKVGVAALFGFAGGAAVDIRKYRQREDKAQPFNWRVAAESWLLAGAAAGLAALGITGAGELPAPVSD
jgi:hypothetical protein